MTFAQAPVGLRRAVARSLAPSLQSQELLGGGDVIDFGYSVAISGTTALVAVPSYFNGAKGGRGAVVYTESGGAWSQQAVLRAPGQYAVSSVALSGTTAVIGGTGGTGGSVSVFSGSGSNWSEQAEFSTSHVAGFGSAVAVSGTTALVGADGGTFGGPGGAFVLAESAWEVVRASRVERPGQLGTRLFRGFVGDDRAYRCTRH